MLEDAEARRNKRAWDRINALIDVGDEEIVRRLESLNISDTDGDT